MNFRELYMNNEIEFDAIFDYTQKWNFSDETRTLREYLGLTPEEEDIWISDSDEALEEYMEEEKQKKILFLDLDGTLLNDEKKVTHRNQKAINKALSLGHKVVIATGRPLPSAILLSEELGLTQEGCYTIAYNGAQIYDLYAHRSIFKETVPLEYVRHLMDEAYRHEIHIQTYSSTHILSEQENPALRKYESLTNLSAQIVPDVITVLTEEPCKVIAIDYDQTGKLKQYESAIAEWSKDKVDSFYSCPQYLEIVSPGMSKGYAIEILCKHLGIPKANTIAAGDAQNDITMLQSAAIAAVMKNASPDIQKYATYVTTKDNNHDGVAEIIEKFIL